MGRIQKAKKAQQGPDAYLIYFIDRDERYWWDWVFHTRPGFRHCFILYWDEYVLRWLLVDWRMRKLDIMMMFEFEAEAILDSAGEANATVVKYPKPEGLQGGSPGLISYCSNMMAKFLGFNNHLIVTPYQLYRKLIAAGGEVVFDWRTDDVRIRAEGTNHRATRSRKCTN